MRIELKRDKDGRPHVLFNDEPYDTLRPAWRGDSVTDVRRFAETLLRLGLSVDPEAFKAAKRRLGYHEALAPVPGEEALMPSPAELAGALAPGFATFLVEQPREGFVLTHEDLRKWCAG